MPVLLWGEISVQFLIPAIFLVIWALNQVFGRTETPTAPGRDRLGPRPSPSGPSRAPQAGRAPGNRTGQPTSPRQAPGRDAARSQGRGGAAGRDRGTSPQAKPAEPTRTPRPRPAVVDEVYAIYEDDRVSPRTVDQPIPAPTPASAMRPAPSATTQNGPVGSPILASVLGRGFDPERLRESFILSEVLAPPIALRGRQRRVMPAGPPPEGQPQGE